MNVQARIKSYKKSAPVNGWSLERAHVTITSGWLGAKHVKYTYFPSNTRTYGRGEMVTCFNKKVNRNYRTINTLKSHILQYLCKNYSKTQNK